MAVEVWRGDCGVIPMVIAKWMMRRLVGLKVSFAYPYAWKTYQDEKDRRKLDPPVQLYPT
jgi:hypothetical protein